MGRLSHQCPSFQRPETGPSSVSLSSAVARTTIRSTSTHLTASFSVPPVKRELGAATVLLYAPQATPSARRSHSFPLDRLRPTKPPQGTQTDRSRHLSDTRTPPPEAPARESICGRGDHGIRAGRNGHCWACREEVDGLDAFGGWYYLSEGWRLMRWPFLCCSLRNICTYTFRMNTFLKVILKLNVPSSDLWRSSNFESHSFLVESFDVALQWKLPTFVNGTFRFDNCWLCAIEHCTLTLHSRTRKSETIKHFNFITTPYTV